ncbi:MAG: hypothetical protein QW424_05235 [Candidatus Bathyarchaeia archaeon]
MPILNVKALRRRDIELLASLFNELETETRRLSGADTMRILRRFGIRLSRRLT